MIWSILGIASGTLISITCFDVNIYIAILSAHVAFLVSCLFE
jgi:hypothetical protein